MARTLGICTDRDITYIEGLVGGGYTFKARLHFTGGGTFTPSAAAAATVAQGRLCIIRLEPRNADGTDIPGVLDQINAGQWDARIQALATWLLDPARLGKRIEITPLHEMNGDWYGWSGTQNGGQAGDGPAKYRAAYRRIVSRLRAAGVGSNVTFGWNPNNGATPGGGMPSTLMSDDFTGTDGAVWDSAKWALGRNSSDAIGGATIVGNRGRLATGAQGAYSGQARVSRRVNITSRTDGEMSGTFALDSSEAYLSIWGRASSALDTASGYYLNLFKNQTPKIGRAVSFAGTDLATLTTTALAAGTPYGFRLRVVGTTVQAKVWPAASAEPSAWQATVTDSTVTAAGHFGFSVGGGAAASSATVSVDDFILTNGQSTSWNDYKNYYPGDDVVDVIGFDGYNDGGTWATVTQLFNGTLADKSNSLPCYDRVYQTGAYAGGVLEPKWCNLDGKIRPFAVYETGSIPDAGASPNRKGDFFASIIPALAAMPQLQTLVVYEVITSGKDRRVDVDVAGTVAPTGYAATQFKAMALDAAWGGQAQILGGPYAFALADGAVSTAFTHVTSLGTGSLVDVQAQELRLGTGNVGNGRVSAVWVGDPVADCEITGKVRWDANTASPRIYARANSTIDTTAGYFLLFDSAANVIKVGHAGVELATAPLAQTVGTAYRYRFLLEGSRIRARAWLATGTEPTTWGVDVTDSTYPDAGRIGFTTFAKVLTTRGYNYHDDVTISAGTASPTPENLPPVLGPLVAAVTGTVGSPFTASITASDPGGEALTYSWQLVTRPTQSTALLSSSTSSVTFTPDRIGLYQIRVTVREAGGLTASVLTDVNVSERAIAAGNPRWSWDGTKWVKGAHFFYWGGWGGSGPDPSTGTSTLPASVPFTI